MTTTPYASAFPAKIVFSDRGEDYEEYHHGLTKREYFAARALQGLLASGKPWAVRDAVYAADNLIKELDKETE